MDYTYILFLSFQHHNKHDSFLIKKLYTDIPIAKIQVYIMSTTLPVLYRVLPSRWQRHTNGTEGLGKKMTSVLHQILPSCGQRQTREEEETQTVCLSAEEHGILGRMTMTSVLRTRYKNDLNLKDPVQK